jgi:hypothetical protein
LNAQASSEEKCDVYKDSFYEELKHLFYHMKILLGDFNEKVGRENIFKPTIGNASLHQGSIDNGVRILNFATSKSLVLKGTIYLHRNFHVYTWTSPEGKTHNQINHILIDRRRNSSILDVSSIMPGLSV